MELRCANCNVLFRPDHYHPHQIYCSKDSCQRARRNKWQQEKLKVDKDYQANQKDLQIQWRASNPHYWKKYRAAHPDYTERNRILQKQRRIQAVKRREQSSCVAKMDVACWQRPLKSGRYRFEPLGGDGVAKMDVVIVELVILESLAKTG
jgi:hypothetical protein